MLGYFLRFYWDSGIDKVHYIGSEELHDQNTFNYYHEQLKGKATIKASFNPAIKGYKIGMAEISFPYAYFLSGPDGKTLIIWSVDVNSYQIFTQEEYNNSQKSDDFLSKLDFDKMSDFLKEIGK